MSLQRRILLAALVGSTIEWFDYFLYGTVAALIFAPQFFPTADPTAGLLLSYLSFAFSFFVRPFGGALCAHIGDRIGRKKTLIWTLAVMGGGTVLIGLLPNHASIGVAAPILLVGCRLLQGIGIGGEWGGAMLLAYENAPPRRRALYGSVPQMGVTVGMLLSSVSIALASRLPAADFQRWGWRIPFLCSIVLIGVGLWMRAGIDETPEFAALSARGGVARSPLLQTLRLHWREVLIAIGAKCVDVGPFYIFTVFIISYATKILRVDQLAALNAVSISALLGIAVLPAVGWLGDRFGSRRVFLAGCFAMVCAAAPYFMLLDRRTGLAVIGATALMMVLVWPLAMSLLGTVTADLFSTEVRYTGITLGYQIGAALVGGTAPLLATWILSVDNNRWRFIAAFLALMGAVSGMAVLAAGRRRDQAAADTGVATI